jgi:uncharacterized membrane protein YdbT with pleckstrin-like domain
MKINNEPLLRPAMGYALLKVIPLVLLSLVFLLLAWKLSPFFLFFSIAVLGAAWYRLLWIRSHTWLITPEFIRISRGIFFKRTDQLEMFRIKDYIVTQPLSLRLLNLMNVILKGTDPENPVVFLTGIPASDLIDTIREYVQEARKDNNIYEIN